MESGVQAASRRLSSSYRPLRLPLESKAGPVVNLSFPATPTPHLGNERDKTDPLRRRRRRHQPVRLLPRTWRAPRAPALDRRRRPLHPRGRRGTTGQASGRFRARLGNRLGGTRQRAPALPARASPFGTCPASLRRPGGLRSSHWKVDAIDEYAADRPAAWVDDNLSVECPPGPSAARHRRCWWTRARSEGLTDEHVERLLAWADGIDSASNRRKWTRVTYPRSRVRQGAGTCMFCGGFVRPALVGCAGGINPASTVGVGSATLSGQRGCSADVAGRWAWQWRALGTASWSSGGTTASTARRIRAPGPPGYQWDARDQNPGQGGPPGPPAHAPQLQARQPQGGHDLPVPDAGRPRPAVQPEGTVDLRRRLGPDAPGPGAHLRHLHNAAPVRRPPGLDRVAVGLRRVQPGRHALRTGGRCACARGTRTSAR